MTGTELIEHHKPFNCQFIILLYVNQKRINNNIIPVPCPLSHLIHGCCPWPRAPFPHCRIVADGIVTDSTNLVLLFYLAQLFLRELVKSYRLLQVIPMDMSSYYGELGTGESLRQPLWGQTVPQMEFKLAFGINGSRPLLSSPIGFPSGQRTVLGHRIWGT